MKAEVEDGKQREGDLKLELWRAKTAAREANQKTNDQTQLIREVTSFCAVDPEQLAKAKFLDLSKAGSGALGPAQVIGMMAEFTKRARDAQKSLSGISENIIRDLDQLPIFRGLSSFSPARDQDSPIRKGQGPKLPETSKRLTKLSGAPPEFVKQTVVDLGSDEEEPLVRKTRRIPEVKKEVRGKGWTPGDSSESESQSESQSQRSE